MPSGSAATGRVTEEADTPRIVFYTEPPGPDEQLVVPHPLHRALDACRRLLPPQAPLGHRLVRVHLRLEIPPLRLQPLRHDRHPAGLDLFHRRPRQPQLVRRAEVQRFSRLRVRRLMALIAMFALLLALTVVSMLYYLRKALPHASVRS